MLTTFRRWSRQCLVGWLVFGQIVGGSPAFAGTAPSTAATPSSPDAPAVRPNQTAPIAFTMCEIGDKCSKWTFRGKVGSGVGPAGETEVLTIDHIDDHGIIVERTDTVGPSAGLTAEYVGRIMDKGRIEGIVTSRWPGHWDAMTSNWHTVDAADAPVAGAAAQGASGSMVGRWGPVIFSFDDGKTVHGSEYSNGYNHVYEGKYVEPDRVDFVVTRIDPSGCSTTTVSRWRLADIRADVHMDGFHGCGVNTGDAVATVYKASGASQAANARAVGIPAEGLLLLLMGAALAGGGDDACRGRGCD